MYYLVVAMHPLVFGVSQHFPEPNDFALRFFLVLVLVAGAAAAVDVAGAAVEINGGDVALGGMVAYNTCFQSVAAARQPD